DGAVGTLAVSPDGRWLAVAGRSLIRGGSTFRKPGVILPKLGGMDDTMRKDRGTIFVFDTRSGDARVLRGHLGPVLSMAFAPAYPGKPPLLVSAAREWNEEKYAGNVRLWDISKNAELDNLGGLNDPVDSPPGIAAWHTR